MVGVGEIAERFHAPHLLRAVVVDAHHDQHADRHTVPHHVQHLMLDALANEDAVR